jgi:hypothetical protein
MKFNWPIFLHEVVQFVGVAAAVVPGLGLAPWIGLAVTGAATLSKSVVAASQNAPVIPPPHA